MAKRRKPAAKPSPPTSPSPPPSPAPARSSRAGLVLAALGAAAAAFLALRELASIPLPGCGPESACDRASASAWGSLPLPAWAGGSWPVTHLGVAWFLGLGSAWAVTRGTPGTLVRWAARAGALGSLLWTWAMVSGGYLCPWCLAVHASNLALVVLLETRPASASALAGARAFLLAGLAATLVLGVLEARHRARVRQSDALELAESTEAILEAGNDATPSSFPPLTGRWRVGPEAAPIRLVVISDYQCPDCRVIEGELSALLSQRDDVSLSIKHFPYCVDCNRKARELDRNRHPNACWAARAAEAAGILEGTDGFWRMHRWLFARRGAFTNHEFRAGLPQIGFDHDALVRVMRGEETLERVEADVEEALDLGIHSTPMIFVNGVELRGWRTPGALTETVERLAATDPPALTAEHDRPPRGLQKFLEDWRDESVRELPADAVPHALGDGGSLEAVLWGDYRDPNTQALDARVRAFLADRPEARYSYRHFPFDSACNPSLPRVVHAGACLSARAAEVAARIGGEEAFWRLHERLFDLPEGPDEEALADAAEAAGLDRAAFLRALAEGDVEAAVQDDVEAARSLGVTSIPALFLDGKLLPRWKLEGERVPEKVMLEALAD